MCVIPTQLLKHPHDLSKCYRIFPIMLPIPVLCIWWNPCSWPRGFYTECGSAWNSSPPPSHDFPYPEILKLSRVIIFQYLHVTECQYVSSKCLKILPQIVSEAIWEDVNSWGACPQTPLAGHRRISYLTMVMLNSLFPPPPISKVCMKHWMVLLEYVISHLLVGLVSTVMLCLWFTGKLAYL